MTIEPDAPPTITTETGPDTPAGQPRAPYRNAWLAMARNPVRYLLSSDPWRALTHLAVSLVLGWIQFGLFIVIILLPFAPAWSYVLAKLERRRVALLRLAPIADPHRTLYSRGVAAHIGDRLAETSTWRETGYSLILAAATPFLSIGLVVLGAAVGGTIFAPAFTDTDPMMFGGWTIDTPAEAWTATVIGIVLLIPAVYLCAAVSAILASLAQALLGPREEELAAQLADVRASRGILMNSFEGERRRIERDLHDGPQRDLVALSMQLGELQLAVDDDDVRTQVIAAQARVEGALSGLRDTVRGVYPQVLDDHGVTAALIELGRGPLPVHVVPQGSWHHTRRFTPEVEKAIYYTGSEAVTNATKHARAHAVTIYLSEDDTTISMEIVDDGIGGATTDRGSGLSGLVERAAAVGARLDIDSPQGGPTVLRWSKTKEL
ncbi:putative two-component histidine kinase [Gordonia soli NBRC 108243]|uniref:histidine kinase n=2 Tax=Gordonia soli TaxID=320799 RepID=M0QMH1_9ACTN|nr:putative two-component histidine kinase [Gordonia soli NBRC 108243]